MYSILTDSDDSGYEVKVIKCSGDGYDGIRFLLGVNNLDLKLLSLHVWWSLDAEMFSLCLAEPQNYTSA